MSTHHLRRVVNRGPFLISRCLQQRCTRAPSSRSFISSQNVIETLRKRPSFFYQGQRSFTTNESYSKSTNNFGTGPDPQPQKPEIPGSPPSNFAKPTLTALGFWLRFVKFSAIGLASITLLSVTAFGATHLYIEYFRLTPDADVDGTLALWGWDKDAEHYSGTRTGTDPGLGWQARTAVRAAWTVLHWGSGPDSAMRTSQAHTPQTSTGAVDATLGFAHDFLNLALAAAMNDPEGSQEKLHPRTLPALLALHARTLERIGSRGALQDARLDYEQIWARRRDGGDVQDAARVALRLGDVCARLDDGKAARMWWGRALALAWRDNSVSDSKGLPTEPISPVLANDTVGTHLPSQLPSSKRGQRTIARTLASLSAHYAQNGRMDVALDVQQHGIALLTPEAAFPVDAQGQGKNNAESLHRLLLMHRAALLALHQVEVRAAASAASAKPTKKGRQDDESGRNVAEAARDCMAIGVEMETAARLLGGIDPTSALSTKSAESQSAMPSKELTSPPTKMTRDAPPTIPATVYTQTQALDAPSRALMRDIRRTAVGGWLLAGVLLENALADRKAQTVPKYDSSSKSSWFSSAVTSTSSNQKGKLGEKGEGEEKDGNAAAGLQRLVLECYSRAVAWTGEDTPEVESAALVARLTRAQNAFAQAS